MKAENIIAEKSLEFAIRIMKLTRYLRDRKHEYELASQILRSGTSIGANVHEAIYGQSRGDFISKMSIALKEASETKYWLVLLNRSGILSNAEYESLIKDDEELLRILTSIVKSGKDEAEK